MSRSADDEHSSVDPGWSQAREELFHMIMEGRSFSGRERNCCFLNTGQERFATISAVSGLDFPDDARCIAITDWDQDGDQDLWISNRNGPRIRFMRNQTPTSNHFLSLRLEGDGQRTNRDAIGARVVVEALAAPGQSPARWVQTLRAGEGFLSQSSKWLHFGLGAADTVDRVTVYWPGGEPQTFNQLKVDSRYRLLQHQSDAQRVEHAARPLVLQPQAPDLPPETRVARVALETRLPMLSLKYTSSTGEAITERFDTGKPTLVNLWASWCRPCVAELADFATHQQQLADAGIRIVSLSVDQADEEPASVEDVERLVQQLGYPFPWGHLDASQLDYVQGLHNLLFFLRRPLPLPSSFLIDEQGRLSVIYRGPVTVDQLLEDARYVTGAVEPTPERAACLPGRSIDHPRVQSIAQTTESQTRHRVASWLQTIRQIPDALEHFLAMHDSDPTSALPPRRLAKIYLDQNDLDPAAKYAAEAIRLNPSEAESYIVMGLIYSRTGNQSAAEQEFRLAIKYDERLAGAHNNLGIVLAMQGRIAEAGDCFLRAVELDDQFVEGHINLGNVFAGQGDFEQASQHYRRAIELDPNNVEPYNNLGTMHGRLGDLEKAIQYYRQALRLQPNNPNTRRNLDRALQVWNATRQQQSRP